MKLFRYTDSFLDTYKSWCAAHGQSCPDGQLPPHGWVVAKDKKPLAVGWTYLAHGIGCYWFAWITTNPDNTPMESVKAIRFMLREVAAELLKLDYNICFSMSASNGLTKLFEREGFTLNHTAMQVFKQWEQ